MSYNSRTLVPSTASLDIHTKFVYNLPMTTTINLSLPFQLLKQIDREARAELRTRSEFFREAARAYLLRERNWKTLQRQASARAKALDIRTEGDVLRVIADFRKSRSKSKK